jgi:FkbM family methyltransferase
MIERFLKSLPPNITESPIILDIGSRDGEQALEFASHFPTARVFAFEARPESASQTRVNVASVRRIEVVETAVHNIDGTVAFHTIDEGNIGSSSLFIANPTDFAPIPPPQRLIVTPATRLDTWANAAMIDRFDIVWMDLQGAELLALQGMGNLLCTVQAIQLEISYRQLYCGQVLWPELRLFMESNGMSLVDEWPDVSGYWGDAVFVKRNGKQ